MGLGPSIKMTTLHHYNCPITNRLLNDTTIDFCGIIINGVSENYDDKISTAKQSGKIAEQWGIDGAIVAIDGWGNHHIDFVNVIEQMGLRNIESVGLSYIGQQGRLVCSNPYVSTIIDLNKTESGYETCVVGQNNVTDLDAYKAIEILKSKLRKKHKIKNENRPITEAGCTSLERRYFPVTEIKLGNRDSLENGLLTINMNRIPEILAKEPRISKIELQVISPENHNIFVNSNLDFWPVACKYRGKAGNGITNQLENVTVMLTGVEENTGYQPSNIGSSEGILREQVVFDQAGTPRASDIILHVDVVFREGEARTAEGIMAVHRIVDEILKPLREKMKTLEKTESFRREIYHHIRRDNAPKIALVKIVSGLGNMYDTSIFPYHPGGFEGSRLLRENHNEAFGIQPLECLDGTIHSLI